MIAKAPQLDTDWQPKKWWIRTGRRRGE